MKIISLFICLLLVLTTFTSCSKDEEEYEPMFASALLNSLLIEIVDENGEIADYEKLLSEGKLSVIGQTSKQEKKIRITNYQGKKVIDTSADLPDQKHMVFNTDKTEGHGKTDLLMEIDGKKYLFERPLHADYSFIRASMADEFGNYMCSKATRNFNIVMAGASDHTVIATEKLVPVGTENPDIWQVAGVLVESVVEGEPAWQI